MSEPRGPLQGEPGAPTPAIDQGISRVRIVRWIRPVLGGIALLFVALAAYKIHQTWQGSALHLNWLPLILSSLPLAVAAFWLAWAWKRLLEHIVRRRIATGPAVAINLESQLARYVPGKLGVPAIRMAGSQQLGLPMRTVGSSILIEVATFVAIGSLVSVSWLLCAESPALASAEWLGPSTGILAVVVGLGALGLMTVDRRLLPRAVLNLIGVEGRGTLVPVSVVLSHFGYWLCWGLHGYLVILAVGGGHLEALRGAGLFIAAPILGFLALVSPGGIGVREAVLTVGLMPAVGSAAALAAAGISRAASLLMDVAVWLISRPWRSGHSDAEAVGSRSE